MPHDFEGRYENRSNNHYKFWEIYDTGDGFMASWGRIGSFGQEKLYTFAEARQKAEEKLSKGYEKVSGNKTAKNKASKKNLEKPVEYVSRLSKVK